LSLVALLLFAVLVIATPDEGRAAFLGFDTVTVLGFCAAIFFVVILDHSQLRSTIAADAVMYQEFFYFALYLAILLVAGTSLLLAAPRTFPLVARREGLVLKLLYWPLVLGFVLGVTVLIFYLHWW
jgi:hypothetical protein